MSNESLTPDESLAVNGESFHWAKRFLGKKMGSEAAKLYAFCRLLDDMADGDIENGPARLINIREALIEGNTESDPAPKSFSPLMEDQELPLPVLIALIDGLLDDQREEVVFVDEAELLRYAYRVAGTVGLLMCHVLDCHDPDAKAHAIDLGIAMQLTNIARDVLEDAQMGRRYLPATWTGDISPQEIVAAANDPRSQHGQIITQSVKRLLAMAEQFYASGAKGFPQLHWRAHMSIAIAAKVYRQIGVQLANKDYIWHQGRQVTSRSSKLICSVKAIAGLSRRIVRKKHEHNSNLHNSLGVYLMSHDIAVIGDGCAALSLAAKAEQLPDYNFTLIRPNGAPKSKDHVWGFWSDDVLEHAAQLARGTWHSWDIITPKRRITMSSKSMPYHAIKRNDWTAHCQKLARTAGVNFIDEGDWQINDSSTIFDTRPPLIPANCILQHFQGLEIKTNTPVFEDKTAILMDFRVDQSKGMHFIYLLPYSSTEALVESTIFSTELVDEQFYLSTIDNYLAEFYEVKEYEITHREKGVIPLGKLSLHDDNIPGLGSNGGATRPASGYAFLFIQRQISSAIERVNAGKELTFSNPHKRTDLWMDSVLLTVLKHWPEHGPNMFSSMARTLTGDQFVKFLSGDAGWWIRLKVIFSMPKIPFLKALTKRAFTRKKVSTAVVA